MNLDINEAGCKWCGKPLIGRKRSALYCSPECARLGREYTHLRHAKIYRDRVIRVRRNMAMMLYDRVWDKLDADEKAFIMRTIRETREGK